MYKILNTIKNAINFSLNVVYNLVLREKSIYKSEKHFQK